ncbi:MAG: lipopolysaccharide transport periplasmic protein LptA [Usitatibacter sp.]
MIAALAPFALVAALVALPAMAERSDREKEIVIGAERSVGDDANKVITLTGNVVVTQGSMRITAAKMLLKEDAKGNKTYVASGTPVTFRQKRDKLDEWIEGTAERAEFDDQNDVLRLYNKARVRSNQNELTGDFISYDMKRELAEVSGAPPGQVAPPNARVKVIIMPPKKTVEGGEEKRPPPVDLKADPGKQ